MVTNTIEQLDNIIKTFDYLERIKTSSLEAIPKLEDKIKNIDNTLNLIGESREYLRKAIDVIYSRSIGELNERINTAIKFIFHDRDLSVELLLEDKRGKSVQIVLKDEQGNEISMKDGCGNGVRTVISCILHMYYLISKNSHVLLIDEKYSYLSESYVPRFFEFIEKLCLATDFSLIMITHDPRFLAYSNKKVRVISGEIVENE